MIKFTSVTLTKSGLVAKKFAFTSPIQILFYNTTSVLLLHSTLNLEVRINLSKMEILTLYLLNGNSSPRSNHTPLQHSSTPPHTTANNWNSTALNNSNPAPVNSSSHSAM